MAAIVDDPEEDLKRLQQETSGGSYSQVGFQYDGQSGASGSAGSTTTPSQLSPNSEESEQPFVLPRTLMMVPPLGMQLVRRDDPLRPTWTMLLNPCPCSQRR